MDNSNSSHHKMDGDNQNTRGNRNGNGGNVSNRETTIAIEGDDGAKLSANGAALNSINHYDGIDVGDGDSKPPANRVHDFAGNSQNSMVRMPPVQTHHNDHQFLSADFVSMSMNGSSKIEVPTSQNIEPYLNSLAQRTDNAFLQELERATPLAFASNSVQTISRGTQHNELNNGVNYMGDGSGQSGSNGYIITESNYDSKISADGRKSNSIHHCDIDESKPPARRIGDLIGHTSTANPMPPNYTQQSLAQRTDDPLPPEMERKLPASNAQNFQPTSRGRLRYRNPMADLLSSDGFVPLRFVHVPNNTNAAAPKRAPSVPDLISYLHNNQHHNGGIPIPNGGTCIPLLSDETLRNKGVESRKEQFEERLRRAHLRLNSDSDSPVTRFRSKSTPSRGGLFSGSKSEGGYAKSIGRKIPGHYSVNQWSGRGDADNACQGENSNLNQTNVRQLGTADLGVACAIGFRAVSSVDSENNASGPSPVPAVIVATGDITPGQHADSNAAAVVGTPNNSSVKSSDGSRRLRALSGVSSEGHEILEPPPPPPPATEKERLVERERQARLETERARRRHLALLRERQLEDSGDVVDTEGSDNGGLIGQVSFDAGLHSAPDYFGDNDLVLDLPAGSSSVGSSMTSRAEPSIPRPPLPPPPATERERLVERERQARLETERARRRHLALQRDRHLDDDDCSDHRDMVDNDAGIDSLERHSNFGNNLSPVNQLDGVVATLPQTNEGVEEANSNAPSSSSTEYRTHVQAEARNAEAEANSLSYPMERFLERVDDEGPSILPIDSLPIDATETDNDATALPYTMELFLAENVVVGPADDEGTHESVNRNDVNVGQIRESNDVIIESRASSPNAQPSSDIGANNSNPLPTAPTEWNRETDELDLSSPSVASVIASTNQGSLDDIIENASNNLTDNSVPVAVIEDNLHGENSWTANTESLPSHVSNAPSHESFDTNPHLPHLTEADIAQLAEVEHASTGNAAPQSVRDEPSVSSVIGRATFLDHAFSVATQTTVIESVTETSVREESAFGAFSDIDESVESLNVIRLNSGGSIQTSTSTSGGASSASIEAMPSSDSSDDSGEHLPSEGISDSLSRSMAPGSHPSTDEISQMMRLTEADMVNMAEIDHASIGNAPPHSIRDERLSESSVTERGERQFDITTPITEMSSVDERIAAGDLLIADHSNHEIPSDNSHHSIAAMPSEHGDHDDSDDDMVVYQASMGSSASIEALPSVDLENESGLYNYGALNANNIQHNPLAEELTMDIGECEHDIESAPLLSVRRGEQDRSPPSPHNAITLDHIDSKEKSPPIEPLSCIAPLLILAMAEIPTFIIIAIGNEELHSLLGAKRYQIVLASLVVVTSVLNHSGNDKYATSEDTESRMQLPDWPCIFAELQTCCIMGIFLGFLIGLIGFIMSDLDLWFGTVISLSIAAATIASRLFKFFFLWAFLNVICNNHGSRWTRLILVGCQDFIICLIILLVTHAMSVRPIAG